MSKANDGTLQPVENYAQGDTPISNTPYQPHRQGLHSDDRPYPGEKMCYCDKPKPPHPSNTEQELRDILTELQSEGSTDDLSHDWDADLAQAMSKVMALIEHLKQYRAELDKFDLTQPIYRDKAQLKNHQGGK